jgi:hypothetical protein
MKGRKKRIIIRPEHDKVITTQRDLAKTFNLPRSTVRLWVQARIIPRDVDGRYHAMEVYEWLMKRNEEIDGEDDMPLDLKEQLIKEKIKKEKILSEQASLELDIQKRQLVTVDSVADAFRQLAETTRTSLESAPSRFALETQGMTVAQATNYFEQQLKRIAYDMSEAAKKIVMENPK